MPKKSTPKKASAPTKTPAPKKAAPKKAAPKKPPAKKASAPNKEITSDIEASASHLPAVSKKTFTAKKNVEANIEDFDLEEYKVFAQDTSRHSHFFQCILLCFDTFPLDHGIPNLDHDIPLSDHDVLSLNDRDIPLPDCDVLSP